MASSSKISPHAKNKAIRAAGLDPRGMTDGERDETYGNLVHAGYAFSEFAVADLERLASGDPEALDEEYGFNNDELLRLGIGYGIPGPLSDEQVRREAQEILDEMGEA